MVNCNYPNCKKHKSCNLQEPITKKGLLLSNEIGYWLKELRSHKWRMQEYEDVLKDITTYHTYSIPVNVYGHIEYAPKTNAFGVYIRRPEHVYYGWNWNKLNKEMDTLTERIRELRLLEYRIDDYSIDEIREKIKEIYGDDV